MKITIADYNPQWPVTFLKEHDTINRALMQLNPVIEHIGSTAVYGLAAKPVIDILVGLEDESCLRQVIQPMINTGFVYFKKYEPMMPYRRYFVRLYPLAEKVIPDIVDVGDGFVNGRDFTTVTHIHIMEKNADHFIRHIAFRDYLRAHDDVRDEYDALKRELAQREYKDNLAYNDAKNQFVKQTEKDAVVWFNR